MIDAGTCSLTRAFSQRCVFAIIVCSGSGCWSRTWEVGCNLPRRDISWRRSPARRISAALDLGFLGGARAIPVLLLSPVAGVVADTLPRRRVLLATNTADGARRTGACDSFKFGRLDLVLAAS